MLQLHQTGVIKIAQFNTAIEIYFIPTRCYSNQLAVFEQKIGSSSTMWKKSCTKHFSG